MAAVAYVQPICEPDEFKNVNLTAHGCYPKKKGIFSYKTPVIDGDDLYVTPQVSITVPIASMYRVYDLCNGKNKSIDAMLMIMNDIKSKLSLSPSMVSIFSYLLYTIISYSTYYKGGGTGYFKKAFFLKPRTNPSEFWKHQEYVDEYTVLTHTDEFSELLGQNDYVDALIQTIEQQISAVKHGNQTDIVIANPESTYAGGAIYEWPNQDVTPGDRTISVEIRSVVAFDKERIASGNKSTGYTFPAFSGVLRDIIKQLHDITPHFVWGVELETSLAVIKEDESLYKTTTTVLDKKIKVSYEFADVLSLHQHQHNERPEDCDRRFTYDQCNQYVYVIEYILGTFDGQREFNECVALLQKLSSHYQDIIREFGVTSRFVTRLGRSRRKRATKRNSRHKRNIKRIF